VHDTDQENRESAERYRNEGRELLSRAHALVEQGDFGAAVDLLRENVGLAKDALGVEHPEYAGAMVELARVLGAQGKHAEAETLLRKALTLFERAPGVEHPPYGQSLQMLSAVLGAQDKFDEAETLLREALAAQEKALGPDHASLSFTLTNLGIALVQQQRLGDAEPVVERALVIVEATLGMKHPETARILTIMAQIQAALGREQASATARRALDTLVKTHGEDHPLVQDVQPLLKEIAEPSGELDALLEQGAEAMEARDAMRAIELLTPAADRAHAEGLLPLEASACGMLAQALFVTGRKEDALVRARRALEIAEEAGQEDAATHFRDLLETMEGAAGGTDIPDAFHAGLQAALQQAGTGDPGGAAVKVAALADEAREAGAEGAEATARILLAQLRLAVGDRDAAIVDLRRALEIAEQVGDENAVAHVRGLLEQAGAPT
jgi:tetratricopeptide (TPR) repeat protein